MSTPPPPPKWSARRAAKALALLTGAVAGWVLLKTCQLLGLRK